MDGNRYGYPDDTAITLSFRMYHGFMVSHTGYLVDRVNVHVQT